VECGIFGRIGVPATLEEAEHLAGETIRLLKHRGPDGDASFVEGQVILGSTRLAIMDPTGGNQPFYNATGEIVAFFNGEIYNWADLAAGLRREGRYLQTRCDGEVLPHLYERYGDRFLSMLDGMFALAIWDRRNQRLLLFVDRVGIKPLYQLACPQGGWAFASEIRALPGLSGEPLALDPHAVSEYLCLKAPYSNGRWISSATPDPFWLIWFRPH
jgi:asparagine synthase (glutamine-hydrolysing)